jgi:hypothetical protein
MNKNEELVISYLSGEMNNNNLLDFELRLNTSLELQKLVEEYSTVFNKINQQKSIEGNYFYFQNILPRFFRNETRINRFSFAKRFAYTAIFILFIAGGYYVFNHFDKVNNIDSIEKITQNATPDQVMDLIDEYSLVDNADFTDLNTSSLIDQQLNSFYDNSIQKIANKLEVRDLTDDLSESETNQIYSELINKKIF